MKLYVAVLATCWMSMTVETNTDTTVPLSSEQIRAVQPNNIMRQKRHLPALPIVGDVLGAVGETVLTLGTGFLGAKAGMYHGAQAGHALNHGDWGYGPSYYSGPGYGNGYYGPGYGNGYYAQPTYANGYVPSYPYGYYGPVNGNGYYGPGNGNGYYGPGNGNGYYRPNHENIQTRPANGNGNGNGNGGDDNTEGSGNGCRFYNGQVYC